MQQSVVESRYSRQELPKNRIWLQHQVVVIIMFPKFDHLFLNKIPACHVRSAGRVLGWSAAAAVATTYHHPCLRERPRRTVEPSGHCRPRKQRGRLPSSPTQSVAGDANYEASRRHTSELGYGFIPFEVSSKRRIPS